MSARGLSMEDVLHVLAKKKEWNLKEWKEEDRVSYKEFKVLMQLTKTINCPRRIGEWWRDIGDAEFFKRVNKSDFVTFNVRAVMEYLGYYRPSPVEQHRSADGSIQRKEALEES